MTLRRHASVAAVQWKGGLPERGDPVFGRGRLVGVVLEAHRETHSVEYVYDGPVLTRALVAFGAGAHVVTWAREGKRSGVRPLFALGEHPIGVAMLSIPCRAGDSVLVDLCDPDQWPGVDDFVDVR